MDIGLLGINAVRIRNGIHGQQTLAPQGITIRDITVYGILRLEREASARQTNLPFLFFRIIRFIPLC